MTDTTRLPNASAGPPTDTGNKINAALRYAGSNLTGGLTVFVALGTLSPDQQTAILSSAHQMYEATQSFVGAAANIWYIVFPIAAIYLGKIGVNSSGFGKMMDKVFAAAKGGNVQAQVAIVSAAASPDLGTKAIINPALAPIPATPSTVVASASALPIEAKGN